MSKESNLRSFQEAEVVVKTCLGQVIPSPTIYRVSTADSQWLANDLKIFPTQRQYSYVKMQARR